MRQFLFIAGVFCPGVLSLKLSRGQSSLAATQTNKVQNIGRVVDLFKHMESDLTAEAEKEASLYEKFACTCKDQSIQTVSTQKYHGEEAEKYNNKKEASHDSLVSTQAEVDKTQEAFDLSTAAVEQFSKDFAAMREDHKNKEASLEREHAQLQQAKDIAVSHLDVNTGGAAAAATDGAAGGHGANKDFLNLAQSLVDEAFHTLSQLKEQNLESQRILSEQLTAETNNRNTLGQSLTEYQRQLAHHDADFQDFNTKFFQFTSDYDADTAFLTELTDKCERYAVQQDQRVESRTGELQAIKMAIEILSGHTEKFAAKSMAQMKTVKKTEQSIEAPVFLQTNMETGLSNVIARVNSLNTDSSKSMMSLARIVELLQIQAQGAPLDDVITRINEMINHMTEDLSEQQEAADKCESDLKKFGEQRDAAKMNLDQLNTRTAELNKVVLDSTKAIKEAKIESNATQVAQAEADENRETERVNNEEVIAESGSAREALMNAKAVLADYYESQAFLQQEPLVEQEATQNAKGDELAADVEHLEAGDYTGTSGGAKMVDVLVSLHNEEDRKHTETTTAENDAAESHKQETGERTARLSELQTEIHENEAAVGASNMELSEVATSSEEANAALDAAQSIYDKMEERCLSQEDWKAVQQRRDNEIAGLRDALSILRDYVNDENDQ